MAINNKKYLDLAGLQHLVEERRLNSTETAVSAGLYKIGKDDRGHVVIGEEITPADLGLDSAMHFVGISSTDPATGVVTITTHTGSYSSGDVCLYKRTGETYYEEYVYTGTAWELLGDADSYVLKATYNEHEHDVTVSGTAVTGVTETTAKLSVNKTTANALTGVSAQTRKLVTKSIDPVGGTVSVSKMTAGAAVNVAKAGTARVIGNANVGDAVTVAKRGTQLAIGNAIINTAPTRYGKANVGAAVTYGKANVGDAVTYGMANVGDAVTVATAGTAVTYGTANVGTAVTVATANTAESTFVTGVTASSAAPATTVTVKDSAGTSRQAFYASVNADSETLVLTPVTVAATTAAPSITVTPSTGKIRGVSGTTSITPAVEAPDEQKIRPVSGTVSIKPAVESKLTLTPAVASTETLTPAVEAPDEQTIYGVYQATKKYYTAADDTVSITPAVESEDTVIPAVANGTITPYTETAVTVATKGNTVTVATGALSADGGGAIVATGVTSTDAAFVNSAELASGSSGITVLVDVAANSGTITSTGTTGTPK